MKREAVDVVTGYDRWSLDYDGFANPMVALVGIAFERLLPALDEATVVDLGCGTGRVMQQMLERGACRVLGVDLSTGMLARARERLAPFGDRVRLLRGDLREPWRCSDAAQAWLPAHGVCIALVLEHFDDVQGVLDSAAHAVAAGGWLLLAEMHADLADAGTGAHFEADGGVHVLPSHRHTCDELTEALQAAGFSLEDVLELRADAHVDVIPKLARHGARRVLYAARARRLPNDGPRPPDPRKT